MSASTEMLPSESGASAKFTQEQARGWLAANPNTGKTVREIAVLWGWSKSTTARFLSHGTSAGQDANFAQTGGTSGTSSEAAGRVLGMTPSGTVAAAMPDASDLDDGPPIARAPHRDNFDWSRRMEP